MNRHELVTGLIGLLAAPSVSPQAILTFAERHRSGPDYELRSGLADYGNTTNFAIFWSDDRGEVNQFSFVFFNHGRSVGAFSQRKMVAEALAAGFGIDIEEAKAIVERPVVS